MLEPYRSIVRVQYILVCMRVCEECLLGKIALTETVRYYFPHIAPPAALQKAPS